MKTWSFPEKDHTLTNYNLTGVSFTPGQIRLKLLKFGLPNKGGCPDWKMKIVSAVIEPYRTPGVPFTNIGYTRQCLRRIMSSSITFVLVKQINIHEV